MSIEDRIRQRAGQAVTVSITRRKRSKGGFVVFGPDGTRVTLPTKRIALQFLFAIVRTHARCSFALEAAKGGTR